MMKKGFTIIEVITALFILTMGAGAAFSLLSRTVSFASIINERLVASYLAQEGIEIVRNIRDTNWLEEDALNEGLEEGSWEADYTHDSLANIYDGEFLKLSSGLYQYGAGEDTIFQRSITITNITDGIDVNVNVRWSERNRIHTFEASTRLYNWLPER